MKLDEKLAKQVKEAAYQNYRKLIKNGVPNDKAVKQALKQYHNEIISLLTTTFNQLGVGIITPKKMTKMKVGSVTLSEALYTHGKQTASTVAQIVRQEVSKADDVRKLALKLYEGYGFSHDDIQIEKQLPKYLQKEWNLTKAKKLKTPALRAAYLEAIEAKLNGETKGKIKQKLKVAFEERNRYYANRIAQTELHRARMTQRAQELVDSGVEVVQVRMSASHPVYDVCDYHANLNAHGLGKGYYPIENAPLPPFHPHCRCVIAPAFAKSKNDAKNARIPSPDAQRKLDDGFLKPLTFDERRRLIGSRDALNEYSQSDKPLLHFIDRFKPKDYQTTRIGQVSKFVIVPDMNNNELMDRKKVIAKPVDGQKNWKAQGLLSIVSIQSLAIASPKLIREEESEHHAFTLMKHTLLAEKSKVSIETPLGMVTLDEKYLLHLVEKRQNARERYANFILPTLQDPVEVWEVNYTDGSKRLVFISLFDNRFQTVVIVNEIDNGYVLWNLLTKSRTKDLNKNRYGRLIYRKW